MPSQLTQKQPRPSRAVDDRDSHVDGLGITARRAQASTAGNEGVGEHVRTRFHSGLLAPVKLRIVKDTRTERRRTCFFCRTGLKGRTFKRRSSEIRSSRLT
jgi:hypothetical protein